jgi:uncharacterized glyoxalase superfamily protein PhnB/predicted kinase
MQENTILTPLLVVRGAARAIDFYVRALGARVLARYEHGSERRISHADLRVGDAAFAITEEARTWNSDAPPSLGGSPVVMQLHVDDVEHAVSSMRDAGATVVFPIQEFVGERMARVRDPFGHLWLLREPIEKLSIEEIQRRRDELFERLSPKASSPANAPSADGKDGSTLGNERTFRQGRIEESPAAASIHRERRDKPRIHLVVGPVGAGKSTLALGLARGRAAIRLTLDQWMTALFRQDRPDTGVADWYVERAARCVEQIGSIARGAIEVGTDVVLEIGLLKRRERESFYARAAGAHIDLTIYVVDAARDVRRERVDARNRMQGSTFSMVVPPDIFELASDLWEPPDSAECTNRDVRLIRTDVT